MRAEQEIKDAGGLLAVLRNGHCDRTVTVDARRNAADTIEALLDALEPFDDMARAKGGTPEADELKTVIKKILSEMPFPDDVRALNQFCGAVLGARAAREAALVSK